MRNKLKFIHIGILFLFIILLMCMSCGARKRTVAKHEQVEIVNRDTRYDSISKSIKTTNLSEKLKEVVFEPVLQDAPMIIGRDTIYNTRIVYRDKNKDSTSYEKKIDSVNKKDNSTVKKVEKSKNIESEREGFNWKGLNWTLIFLIVLVISILVYKSRKK